jgi:hypothetical protein
MSYATDRPEPIQTSVRRYPTGLAHVALAMRPDDVSNCKRCAQCVLKTANSNAEPRDRTCRTWMRTSEVNAFLFGPTPVKPTRSPDSNLGVPSGASRFTGKILGYTCLFLVWTDEAWAAEPDQPHDAMPMQGGGRVHVVVGTFTSRLKYPDYYNDHPERVFPLRVRPWTGPAKPCDHSSYLDIRAELVGHLWQVYRLSAWAEDDSSRPVKTSRFNRTKRLAMAERGVFQVNTDGGTYATLNRQQGDTRPLAGPLSFATSRFRPFGR